MKINLISVGKSKDKDLLDSINEYTVRLSKYISVEWKLLPSAKNAHTLDTYELKEKEGLIILNHIKDGEYLVTLDEKGRMLTSNQLASEIEVLRNNSKKVVNFLIGGAYGVSQNVLNRSDMVWSLSKLVFPHQIVRLLLAEQLYRAYTIINNEKYHHN